MKNEKEINNLNQKKKKKDRTLLEKLTEVSIIKASFERAVNGILFVNIFFILLFSQKMRYNYCSWRVERENQIKLRCLMFNIRISIRNLRPMRIIIN